MKKRFLYKIQFTHLKTNYIYIGITAKLSSRIRDHFSPKRKYKSRVLKRIESLGLYLPNLDLLLKNKKNGIYSIKIVGHYEENKAAKDEIKLIAQYRSDKNYKVINQKSGGGLGGSTQLWTEDKIREEALKYNKKYLFKRGSRGAQSAAVKLGILDEVCAHMIPKIKWTKETIKKEADKYPTRRKFRKGCKNAYNAGKNLGILEDVLDGKPDYIKIKKEKVYHSWTKILIYKEARKYKTYKEFREKANPAYKKALKLEIIDDIKKTVFNIKKKKEVFKLSVKEMKQLTKDYKSRTHLEKKFRKAHKYLQENDLLDKYFPKQTRRWTLEEIKEVALKYQQRSVFHKKYPGAYENAVKLGKLDEVCQHMGNYKRSEEDIQKIALKYKKRWHFQKDANGAYKRAWKLGILDKVCSHMDKAKGS